MTMRIETTSWTGNSTNGRVINFVNQPIMLFIFGTTTDKQPMWKSDLMPADNMMNLNAAGLQTGVCTIGTNSITLSSNVNVNGSGQTYYCVAFSDPTNSDLKTFTYSGTGSSQNIATGFMPGAAMTQGTSQLSCWTTEDLPSTHSYLLTTTAADRDLTTAITALNASSITVLTHAAANANGATYYGFAMRKNSGFIDMGSWSGDGTDNKNITIPGMTLIPDFIFTLAHQGSDSYNFYSSFGTSGDASFQTYAGATSLRANAIQARQAGGFQVGTLVNINAITNYYIAARSNAVPIGALTNNLIRMMQQ